MPEANKSKQPKQPDAFADKYPHIADWVLGGGWVEMGQTEGTRSFVRALDEGVMVFEGKSKYRTLEEALQALEQGIAQWTGQNG